MKLISPDEQLSVSNVPLLIYGPPGVGKTTLAQSFKDCVLIDFDRGAHRAVRRRHVLAVESWEDVMNGGLEMLKQWPVIIVDTVGRAIDMCSQYVMEQPSNVSDGTLNRRGWGALGKHFLSFMSALRAMNKQIVFVAHQVERDDDQSERKVLMPDIPGKMSWRDVHQQFDLIGRLYCTSSGSRVLDFTPTETVVVKDAGGIGRVVVDDDDPLFLEGLIRRAKDNMIGFHASVKQAQETLEEVRKFIESKPDAKAMNEFVDTVLRPKQLHPSAARMIWNVMLPYANEAGVRYDKVNKRFV